MRFQVVRRILLVLVATVAAVGVTLHVVHNRQVADRQLRDAFPGDSRAILDQASQIELLSLCPMTDPCLVTGKSKGRFLGIDILGRMVITGSRKAALLSALYHGIAYNDHNSAACFNPRHAIHCVQGKQTVDVVICFQCEIVRIYVNGRRDDLHGDTTISREPQGMFNQTLSEAGLPLAKP